MRWLGGTVLLICSIGYIAPAELPNFDLSPLRPEEPCKPSPILQIAGPFSNGPTVNLCPTKNHIELIARNKTTLTQGITHIRKTSANRAVAVFLEDDGSLLDAALLAPIATQIVQLYIVDVSKDDLTSNFPALDLSSLLDLRFWKCSGLRIHKADFSGLKNIRAIEFQGASPAFVEEGTFINLPTLQTLALGNDIGDWHVELFATWKQLNCDAKNAWLWSFLKEKPDIQKNRRGGEIFTLGKFTSSFLDVEKSNTNCK